MRQVPLQVMSQRTAEAQQQGQHSIARNYVLVSVAADVDSVYKLIQVSGLALLSLQETPASAKCSQSACFFLLWLTQALHGQQGHGFIVSLNWHCGFEGLGRPAQLQSSFHHCWLQSGGPGALSVLQKEKAAKQRLDDFRISVERRLRLRRLARDETVQDEQFVSCCKRMLYNSPSLSQFMEGLAFRISHTNQVSPEGEFIDIAWDFEV